ncbi:hypothetical protein BJX99DRAFT_256607 [Aspergillus californicus]
MAEVLGVVASAISIVTLLEQIVESIDKLKALRKFVKNVPHVLQDLIEEIEIVQGVLRTLTPDMFNFMNVSATERRLRTFQLDLDVLIAEVQKYQFSTGRRIGAFKLALKKEELRSQRDNLNNIKGTLSLLQQAYCIASIQEMSARLQIQDSSTKKIAASDTGSSEEGGLQLARRQMRNRTRHSNSHSTTLRQWEYRFRTPLIVIDKIWTIRATRLFSNWTFNIRTNNVVPYGAPIIRACLHGDIAEVQSLFDSGLASPFDCDPRGHSVLQIAAHRGKIEMSQFLLNNGADANYRSPDGRGILSLFNPGQVLWDGCAVNIPLLINLYQSLIDAIKDDGDLFDYFLPGHLKTWTMGFDGPPEALKLMIEHTYVDYKGLPFSIRFSNALSLRSSLGLSPASLQIAMGGDIEPHVYRMQDIDGRSLLHIIAQGMAVDYASGIGVRSNEWRQLISDAIAANADLNQLYQDDGWGYTPLVSFVEYYLLRLSTQRFLRHNITPIIRLWVTELKLAGVNLEAYGAIELALYHAEKIDYYFAAIESTSFYLDENIVAYFALLGLAYGPEPEDWHAWVMTEENEWVGEFWAMVEKEEVVMPGTWVD